MLSILNVYNVAKVGGLENKEILEVAGLVFSLLGLNASVINPSLTQKNTVRVTLWPVRQKLLIFSCSHPHFENKNAPVDTTYLQPEVHSCNLNIQANFCFCGVVTLLSQGEL